MHLAGLVGRTNNEQNFFLSHIACTKLKHQNNEYKINVLLVKQEAKISMK